MSLFRYLCTYLHLNENIIPYAPGVLELQGLCTPTSVIFGTLDDIERISATAVKSNFGATLRLAFVQVPRDIVNNDALQLQSSEVVQHLAEAGYDCKMVFDDLLDRRFFTANPDQKSPLLRPLAIPSVPTDQKGVIIPTLSVIWTEGKKWVTIGDARKFDQTTYTFPRIISMFGDICVSVALKTHEFLWHSFFRSGVRCSVDHRSVFGVNAIPMKSSSNMFHLIEQYRRERVMTTELAPRVGQIVVVNKDTAHRFGVAFPHALMGRHLRIVGVDHLNVSFVDEKGGYGVLQLPPNGLSFDGRYTRSTAESIQILDKQRYSQHMARPLMMLSAALENKALLYNFSGVVATNYEYVMPSMPINDAAKAVSEAHDVWWAMFKVHPNTPFDVITVPHSPTPESFEV